MAKEEDPKFELRKRLKIDKDDLEPCLVEQPSMYFHIAEMFAKAMSKKDGAKLALDEITAELDGQLRVKASEAGEKITEAQLQRQLSLLPKIQGAMRHYADCRAAADELQALKEAYQQRSFMLRELVAMHIAQLNAEGVEYGSNKVYRQFKENESKDASRARDRMFRSEQDGDRSARRGERGGGMRRMRADDDA